MSELDRVPKQDLAFFDKDMLRFVTEIARHPFARSLVAAEDKMKRYHEIDDSTSLPFWLLKNPGVSSPSEYVDFVKKVDRLSKVVNKEANK